MAICWRFCAINFADEVICGAPVASVQNNRMQRHCVSDTMKTCYPNKSFLKY